MATVSQLIERVQRKVQDNSYTDSDILDFFNEGLREIAAWDNLNPSLGLVGNIFLSALEAQDTVDTSTTDAYVALPENYLKNLYAVTFEGQIRGVSIISNLKVFLGEWDNDLTRTGPVEQVTVSGGNLYYQPIPESVTTLTLYYYKQPDILTMTMDAENNNTNIPSCIPDHLHHDLLVNYAVKEIFDEKEEGMDGAKVETTRYEVKYQQALAKLYQFVKHKSVQAPLIRRPARYF